MSTPVFFSFVKRISRYPDVPTPFRSALAHPNCTLDIALSAVQEIGNAGLEASL